MSTKRKILFLTGTRADFGKLKSLIKITDNHKAFEVHLFVTGMHMHYKYGYTVDEIERTGIKCIYKFINYTSESTMDLTLAKTIEGLSSYVQEEKPDLIVVHGDRVEALAGAIVGALNNIIVAHIEGGEVSGTIDELIRHAVTKMSHVHFVANNQAKSRLVQMGELPDNIFLIGSPDVDIMFSDSLPSLEEVKDYYEIPYQQYAMLMFHPVTTESHFMQKATRTLVDILLEDTNNYVVIYPNNDMGSSFIINEFEKFANNPRFRVFPSLRFEYFLVMLKHSQFIIGNSSAGIREAPYYGVPSINIGTRQNNRALNPEIINCGYEREEIETSILSAMDIKRYPPKILFGTGESNKLFLETIMVPTFWEVDKQKTFMEINSLSSVLNQLT